MPISDREPLRWVLREQRTALPAARSRDAGALLPGDQLLIYVTRGCFRNPTRDRGRVAGLATVRGRPGRLRRPVRVGEREFHLAIPPEIELLAPARQGVELAPLVGQLESFPDPRSWSARLRRSLVPLTEKDARLLVSKLRALADPYPEALSSYAA